ncbi:TlpA family protein disulfide reductase [Polaribacter sp.]|uniref:TlpA family protein disulfide reductase n=1 Tax=Polaribacter sp. TaxID=1920175 RepID=UPI003EFA367B
MFKKILALLFLVTSFVQAQHSIKGTMSPAPKSDWVILYKIEGAKQLFVKNTTIKIDTITTGGKNEIVGNFEFTLPENANIGAYRATYKLEGVGFVDLFYNKENVSFVFNPEKPTETLTFLESDVNILYKEYLTEIYNTQQALDAVQLSLFQNPDLNLERKYRKAYENVNKVQAKYVSASKDTYIYPFVTASSKYNLPEITTSSAAYLNNVTNTFFDNIDFTNKTLLNSSFLVDRITDFIFYLNGSDDFKTQQNLYKNAIEKVLSKIKEPHFRKDVISFLITQFNGSKNIEIVDYLFKNYYNKLPETIQDNKFKKEIVANLAAEVGRIAPNFSWTENKKYMSLSSLDESDNYLLIFWSTTCSHCLNEIPQVYNFLKDNTAVKVVAFAMENDELGFNVYKEKFLGWHHVLGLNKWENKTSRTYNINATPSYFILDADKKIIAKPETIEELKELLSKEE